jgi:AbrB family looped-hinge helix DNA binding protein
MDTSTLTSKGQITIPASVRTALDLSAGDKLVFMVEGDHLVVVPVRRRRLSDLRGALPATRPFPGTTQVREAVGQQLGAADAQSGGSSAE